MPDPAVCLPGTTAGAGRDSGCGRATAARGSVFAGYTIIRRWDAAGADETYLAHDERSLRLVVLRILPVASSDDAGFRSWFLSQAALATGVRHPNITAVRAYGCFAGRLWVAVEHVEGMTAEQLVRGWFPVGMPVARVLAAVGSLAAALDAVHRRGLAHGAVDAANVVVTDPDGRRQQFLLGGFFSAFGPGVDARSDQYGLAETAYHLLTGSTRRSHPGASPRPGDRLAELAVLDAVFDRALATDPTARFADCRAFAHALIERAGILGDDRDGPPVLQIIDYPDAAPGDARPAVTRRPRRSRPTRGVVVAVAAAGLFAVVGVAVLHTVGAAGTGPRAAVPAPAGVPGAEPGPPPDLDGTYRIDLARDRQTYNAVPDPQPPNVSTWWAFRTSCDSGGCVAIGIMLDPVDHRRAAVTGDGPPLTLDLHDGTWDSRPEAIRFPCVARDGAAAAENTTQVIRLAPSGGRLNGVMSVVVGSDECGQQGGEIRIPATADRVGAVPGGIEVPHGR